ncbi:hypothetical protein M885DRAFT_506201 [Pelagophyceae sp. CCMP2097]|nr:hypothetical protein M885DRAFT_506201 [Pelagophyceae sp. CCMP2097]
MASWPELVIDPDDLGALVAAEANAGRRKAMGDGVTHGAVDYEFPAALPCAWRLWYAGTADGGGACLISSSAERRAAFGRSVEVVDGDLRRAALVALGCCGAARAGGRVEYLDSKRAVDERSRCRVVASAVVDAVKRLAAGCGGVLRIVDVGAGTLSMLAPMTAILLRAEVSGVEVEYVAVDSDPALLAAGTAQLDGAVWTQHGAGAAAEWRRAAPRMILRCVAQDAFAFAQAGAAFHVVVANAFADLAAPPVVAALLDRLCAAADAVAYLPITFDGKTWLDPPLVDFDADAFEAYHAFLRDCEHQHVDADALAVACAAESAGAQKFRLVARGGSDWRLDLRRDAFARSISDFVCAAVPPWCLAGRGAQADADARARGAAAMHWARLLRAEIDGTAAPDANARALCAANVDFLFERPRP